MCGKILNENLSSRSGDRGSSRLFVERTSDNFEISPSPRVVSPTRLAVESSHQLCGEHTVMNRLIQRLAPYSLAFFSSMSIMVLELVASRLVARHVGASLTVWTCVIGVMLAGICLGNVLGGRLGDRVGPKSALGPLYAIGSALTIGCLWVNAYIGKLPGLDSLPWDLRTLLVVTLDFLAPTTFLGMISPVVAKMAVEQARKSGSAIGDVYFWGAVGSITGTFLAGFILIYQATNTLIVMYVAAWLAALATALLSGKIGKSLAIAACVTTLIGATLELTSARHSLPAIRLDSVSVNIVSTIGQALVIALGVWGVVRLIASARIPAADGADRLGASDDQTAAKSDGKQAAGSKADDEFNTPDWDHGMKPRLADLAVLSFLASMGFMALEMGAGRMVTRHLGSSIYGWTSVIGVLLGGLSLGNYLGGKIADHIRSEKQASWLFLVASILVIWVLIWETPPNLPESLTKWVMDHWKIDLAWERDSALSWALIWPLSLAWPSRVLLVVSIMFFLPAVGMGTVSPVVAKLAVDRVRRSKRTGTAIGQVYAWGMVGSILGTFLTGFYLIEILGTKGLMLTIAATMALAATFLGTAWHAAWAGIPLGLCIIAFAPGVWFEKQGRAWGIRENHGEVDAKKDGAVAYAKESKYYYIKVENEYDPLGLQKRVLVLDSLIHGYCILDHPERLDYDYEHIYALVTRRSIAERTGKEAASITNFPLKTLFLGGGSYTFPRYILNEYPHASAEVAEIDRSVTETNHLAIGLPRDTPIQTTWGDARRFVENNYKKKKFNVIYGDAFNDFSVPWHLTTLEFNRKIAEMLDDDGIYMINIIDVYESDAQAEADLKNEDGDKKNNRKVRLHAKSNEQALERARSLGGFLGSWVETAKLTFPHIYVFGTNSRPGLGIRETFVVAACKKPLDLNDLGARPGDPALYSIAFPVEPGDGPVKTKTETQPYSDKHMKELTVRSRGIILTDDYAPLDNLLAPVAATRGKPEE